METSLSRINGVSMLERLGIDVLVVEADIVTCEGPSVVGRVEVIAKGESTPD